MIVVVGLSHHTAPIAIRERVALSEEACAQLVQQLLQLPPIAELFIVSTCNRVELIAVSQSDETESVDACAQSLRGALLSRAPEAGPCLYEHHGVAAVRHLIRVAASLDSLVVGEAQILGQLKQGFERARLQRAVGPELHQLFATTARGAKRVRSETSIGAGQVSVPSIAVELAGQIFGDLGGRHAVLVGGGEMGQTVARLLSDAGAKLSVVGRSLERVTPVANRVGGHARLMSDLPQVLLDADVVVSSTSAAHHVLGLEQLATRRRSKRAGNLFLIDLAVPRDIDPKVGELDGVFLYDVDDLSQVASQSAESRKKEAEAASHIVDEVISEWERRVQAKQVTPTIKALRAKMRLGLEAELEKSLRGRLRDLDDEQKAALAKMLDAGLNRILHGPVTLLRAEAGRSETEESSAEDFARTLAELFELDTVSENDLDVPSVRVPQIDTSRFSSPPPASPASSSQQKLEPQPRSEADPFQAK